MTRHLLRGISEHFQKWLKGWTERQKVPVVDAPKGRRDEFVEPYFKGREAGCRCACCHSHSDGSFNTTSTSKTPDGDACLLRMCPYLPFSARICLNQHHWLANRMHEEGISFKQCANAFLKCAAPKRLQELADSLTARELVTCGQKWLARLTPFFTSRERAQAGCQHRLFFSQVEYCDNLIFKRRAALDNLGERLIDANRTIGQPDKITTIFGRRITKYYQGKLQTEIEVMHLPNPVIRSFFDAGRWR